MIIKCEYCGHALFVGDVTDGTCPLCGDVLEPP